MLDRIALPTGGKTQPAPWVSGLPFLGPSLLAPMEGVTDPAFRHQVLKLHRAADLSGTYTEFMRVTDHVVPSRRLREHMGEARDPRPLGLQLMGANEEPVAASARRAAEEGADLVDLNFGCPAKGALRGCAGSGALADPGRMARLVAACVRAVEGRVPVTAKIRAGVQTADGIETLARAVEDGGASMLTVHCRTRAEAYRDPVDWTRIARAVAAVQIPVCGNGNVRTRSDVDRMGTETGCRFVMVGRGALADPWVFSGETVSGSRAAQFLLDYADAIRRPEEQSDRGVACRIKQLLVHWTAGDLVGRDRVLWLREENGTALLDRLRNIAGRPHDGE